MKTRREIWPPMFSKTSVDIWPTLLDLLDLPSLEDPDGRSFLPEILAAAAGVGDRDTEASRFAYLDLTWGRALPRPMQRLLQGPEAPSPAHTFTLEDGESMLRLKQVAAAAFHPDQMARNLADVNSYFDETLAKWSQMGTINFYEESKHALFKSIWAWLTGANETPEQYERIEKCSPRPIK